MSEQTTGTRPPHGWMWCPTCKGYDSRWCTRCAGGLIPVVTIIQTTTRR